MLNKLLKGLAMAVVAWMRWRLLGFFLEVNDRSSDTPLLLESNSKSPNHPIQYHLLCKNYIYFLY